jgi:hypothetical protein
MKATVSQILAGIDAREKDYATMNSCSGNSGPYSRCVKCGGIEASMTLKKKSLFGFIEGGNTWELFTDTAYEVIERRCPKCGHTWEEKPLDASRNEAADIARKYKTIHQPSGSSHIEYQNVDQAVGVMDSLCASFLLPPALYDWQKEAWAYIRSYIMKNKRAPFPCPHFSYGNKCAIGLMSSTGCQVHCQLTKSEKREPISYKRTDLVNKWLGYIGGFETEQKEQSQVYPPGYVRNLLESFVSDLKSGLEKFEEVQKV